MVRVYIVIQYFRWEDYSKLLGVFSTQSKAERWKREFEEDCDWNPGEDWYLEITPWVVDGEI